MEEIRDPIRVSYHDLPGFPVSGVSGHAGELVAGYLDRELRIMLAGRIHYYEHGDANAMRVPIEVLRGLGVQSLILTNSAGSLREDLPPGSVMQITDHINFSGVNPLIGEESDSRFVGMTSAYDAELAPLCSVPQGRRAYRFSSGVVLRPELRNAGRTAWRVVLGADVVGMSTVPEVIPARFFGLRVAAASVITNFGAGMTAR